MRLALDPRVRRLLRRVPRDTVYSAMELALLSLLALQGARLVWTLVTPVDPVGSWRASSAVQPVSPLSGNLLGEFDPFFRLSGDGSPMVVTSLQLKLFGVRENRATGRGSAIISTPDGEQRSFAVGDEIVPGVTLTAVNFDNVVILRGGTTEQLFLDQSQPAAVVSPDGRDAASQRSPLELNLAEPEREQAPASSFSSIASQANFQPRMEGAQVTGIVVQPQGSGEAFRAAGFAPGDVIISLNGQRIKSAEQARSIASQLSGDSAATVEVERDGRTLSLRVRPSQ
jgi:general secretion pathway protein C